jgi:LytS/YehU family sensor histidine kinase
MVDVTARHNAEVAHERLRETERLLADARWQTLRYQLNPHFLFNVLTSVEALSREAPGKIPGLMRRLAAYLRLTLEPHDRPRVPIEQEMEALQAYLDIEKVRFEEQLDVAIELDPAARGVPVPGLLFQPLIENSIKYGMRTSAMPLKIVIRIQVRDDHIEVAVGNSGYWVEAGSAGCGEGVGLANLRGRLELLFGDHYDFKTEECENWVWVAMQIPRELSGPESAVG